MLYYLALKLTPQFGFLNVFSYITVRAAGALVTGFLICLLLGPSMIEALKALKVGQFIKKDHVKDLHDLHQGKAGTPTMGGLLFIVATVLSLALWSTLTNRALVIAVAVLCMMGAVGFADDYIKLRRKKNDGLSARMKMAGQIGVGTFLGIAVMVFPVTLDATHFVRGDVTHWNRLAESLVTPAENTVAHEVADRIPADLRTRLANLSDGTPSGGIMEDVLIALNDVMDAPDFPASIDLDSLTLDDEANALLAGYQGAEALDTQKRLRLNRLLIAAAFPDALAPGPSNLQTKIAIPGIKNFLIPLGPFYVLFVILIIVATSNGVNLTDGLDGLAAGASVISIFALTGIAYVVSRADWSGYLFLSHIPDASELAVFGAALLGTGLGFLWYNAHPAEVFMGDTGSLALGGVIGAMAVLTKQELLLPLVGGLFVLETMSVIIQVTSFKLTGKRVFRMAPLHHHFELMGWSESKVTIRFWILAFLFALMSLATLKLR